MAIRQDQYVNEAPDPQDARALQAGLTQSR
jgi:hypothetical protein